MTITQAIKYLRGTTTALTRRRGRKAVKKALAAILKEYPPMSQEGKKKVACVCPICKIPAMGWLTLVKHLARMHGMTQYGSAPVCGCPACGRVFKTRRGLAGHLSSLARTGKLVEHCVPAAAKAAVGGKP